MIYSKKLNTLFSKPIIAAIISFSILIYISLTLIAATENIDSYENFLFFLNCIFIFEITLRAFTYRKISHFFRSHTLDIIAVFPWDIAIFYTMGNEISSNLLVTIRLFRLFRLRSFFNLWKDCLKSRIHYTIKKQIEQSLSKQFLLLLTIIVSLTIIFGFFFEFLGYSREKTSLFYMAFMALLDPGTSIEVANEGLSLQVVFNSLTLIGIVLFNGLTIGIIVAKVESYLDKVKEGYGDVVEKEHTLILGWSLLGEQLLEEINDYALQESRQKQTIVILTEQIDRLTQFLKSNHFKYLDVVRRKGLCFEEKSLRLIDTSNASKVIILNECDDISLPLYLRKANVFKACLAVNAIIKSSPTPPLCYYETTCQKNRERLSHHLSENFLGFDSSRYSSLLLTSILFHKHYYDILIELFGFADDEFHFIPANKTSFLGKKFSEVLHTNCAIIPVGIVNKDKKLKIIPPENYIITKDDQLIFLGESLDSIIETESIDIKYKNSNFSFSNLKQKTYNQKIQNNNQHIVIIGVNETLPKILNELMSWNTYVDILTTPEGKDIFHEYTQDTPVNHNDYQFCYEEIENYDFSSCFGVIVLADDIYIKKYDFKKVDTDSLFKVLDITSHAKNKPTVVEVVHPNEEFLFQNIDRVKHIVGTNILAKVLNMSLVYPYALQFLDEIISLKGATLNFIKLSSLLKSNDNEKIFYKPFYRNFYEQKNCISLGIIREGCPPLLNPMRINQIRSEKYVLFKSENDDILLNPDDEIIFLEKNTH